jgi:hypothetical protein
MSTDYRIEWCIVALSVRPAAALLPTLDQHNTHVRSCTSQLHSPAAPSSHPHRDHYQPGLVVTAGTGAGLGIGAHLLQQAHDNNHVIQTNPAAEVSGIVLAEGRPVPGQWSDRPKPPPPDDTEVDDLVEHAWDKHVVDQGGVP